MIVPDLNLLVYAYDQGSASHSAAKKWWSDCLSGSEPVGLSHVVLFGFVRVMTNRRVFEQPLSLDEACGFVASWTGRTVTRVLAPDVDHFDVVAELLRAAGGAGGNLVTDAQIAQLALRHRGVVHTADHDFSRFPGLSVVFPLDH